MENTNNNSKLTLFFPMFPFDRTENITKPKVFRCFQGDQKEILRRKGLTTFFTPLFQTATSDWLPTVIDGAARQIYKVLDFFEA